LAEKDLNFIRGGCLARKGDSLGKGNVAKRQKVCALLREVTERPQIVMKQNQGVAVVQENEQSTDCDV
jgi:hypothetical protein